MIAAIAYSFLEPASADEGFVYLVIATVVLTAVAVLDRWENRNR